MLNDTGSLSRLDSESEANIPVGFSSRSQFRPPCYTRRTALHPNSEMLIIGVSQFWAVMNAVLPNCFQHDLLDSSFWSHRLRTGFL